jgi:ADP-ribose pyrophosphatase YjhB (NUDIX family)
VSERADQRPGSVSQVDMSGTERNSRNSFKPGRGTRPLPAAELKELYRLTDWAEICRTAGLPSVYNGFPAAGMLAAHVLPYLLPLASERALANVLAEHELLQTICFFVPIGNAQVGTPSRATLWHFRRRFAPQFRIALLAALVTIGRNARMLGVGVPFVSSPVFDSERLGPDILKIDGSELTIWSSAPGSSLTDRDRKIREAQEAQFQLPLLEARRAEHTPKHKYGLADEVGLPALVKLAEGNGSLVELYLIKPSWLYQDTRLKDPLTTIGPSHVKGWYTACNVLVLRDKEGRKQALLAQRLTGYGRGQYAIPGGKKREDETVEKCAARELNEEAGLHLTKAVAISVVENKLSEEQTVTSVGILAQEYSGEPVNLEREQMGPWEWFDLDRLPPNIFTPSKWVIDAYLDPDCRVIAWSELETRLRQIIARGREVRYEGIDLALRLWGSSNE